MAQRPAATSLAAAPSRRQGAAATGIAAMVTLAALDERQLLALAISQEEEDARVYADVAEALRHRGDAEAASRFAAMSAEEDDHRRRLLDLFQERFGRHVPLVRRQDVQGFVRRRPFWLRPGFDAARASIEAEAMEVETRRFYARAAAQAEDAAVRRLLGDLAAEEVKHEATLGRLLRPQTAGASADDAGRRRLFVLQYVQPGLAGLMDGSVSTLAPLFAAAFATHDTFQTFLVGLAAALGAGISMGFAEALSDDGSLTGRGSPWLRGLVCGGMTAVGGLGHALPYLLPSFWVATALAGAVVLVELAAIAWVRHRWMDAPWVSATIQVVLGGAIVFGVGVLIGSS
jgi:erythrin-vacuolar iron transport family protein